MREITLQLKAMLENVTDLRPVGGHGSASRVQKCKLCALENSIEILSSTIKSYNSEDNEKFKTIVEFECRGLEPIDFQPQAGFAAKGVESGTVFSDINLQEKDWTDYDEKAQESVEIFEVRALTFLHAASQA
ncbi:hypothetical protein U0070_000285 [Myodes glareolus]|uniref:CXXC motif containing zinc binding protein n=1 Tax=Myodes glareolus TaxID=447135 RepID=A0AAW0I5Y9_MYOGA